MLRSAGLILRDEYMQIEGVTYAGILLFGQDSTIMSVLPQHKTDALFRVFNVDRYDDRDVVITNLIESYDRLMAFGQKHLNDTFHLDGIQSVSARDNILREIISLAEVATATVGPEGTVPHDVPYEDVAKRICELIKANPHITRKEIGERLGISMKTVGRKLKGIENIKYVGSGNNGHWEIVDNL